jgi:hypothetical protein
MDGEPELSFGIAKTKRRHGAVGEEVREAVGISYEGSRMPQRATEHCDLGRDRT